MTDASGREERAEAARRLLTRPFGSFRDESSAHGSFSRFAAWLAEDDGTAGALGVLLLLEVEAREFAELLALVSGFTVDEVVERSSVHLASVVAAGPFLRDDEVTEEPLTAAVRAATRQLDRLYRDISDACAARLEDPTQTWVPEAAEILRDTREFTLERSSQFADGRRIPVEEILVDLDHPPDRWPARGESNAAGGFASA